MLGNKKKDVLIHATAWMNPENVMLFEKTQQQKDHILYNPVYVKWPKEANLWRQNVD